MNFTGSEVKPLTQLERVRVAEPVSGMSLRVTTAEPLLLSQAHFMEAERAEGLKQLSTLIDRLSNRLGREAVTRPTLVPDPQPEYGCRFEPAIIVSRAFLGRQRGEVDVLADVQRIGGMRKPSW